MSCSSGSAPSEQCLCRETNRQSWKVSIRSSANLKGASSREDISTIGLLDALDLDSRPSFAIDLFSTRSLDAELELIYCNPALVAAEELMQKVTGVEHPQILFSDASLWYAGFKDWLFDVGDDPESISRGGVYTFEGYLWSATAIGRYKIVSGVLGWWTLSNSASGSQRASLTVDPREHREPKNLPVMMQDKLPTLTEVCASPPVSNHGSFDLTVDHPEICLSDHIRYFRGIDWTQTPLGPMKTWSPQLRCIVNMVLNNTRPALLLWGNDVIMVYNEAYIQIISMLHPCMGKSARTAARDYWLTFQPLVDYLNATGKTLDEYDLPIFVDRHGFLEETFWSFQLIPVLDNAGHVTGYYQPLTETTRNNILQRRVSSLVEIGSQTAKARDLQAYWDTVLRTLALNQKDAPLVLLYATEHQNHPDIPSISSPGSTNDVEYCVLQGAIAVEMGHPIAPPTINLREDSYIFLPYLLQAARTRRSTIVHLDELDMPESMLENIQWKGYDRPCRSVVVCPILPTTSEQVLGFLILGVNPHRPYDEGYQQFVQVTLRLLSTSLASVVLFDEEMRQKENAIGQAARIQEQLLAELHFKEKKFQRFAERSDVGIFITDSCGTYTYRNQSWFDLFEYAAEEVDVAHALRRVVSPEDVSFCEGLFTRLAFGKEPVCFELKTTMPWFPPTETSEAEGNNHQHFKWILCSAYPELGPGNEVVEIVGNVTDISKQKWDEYIQTMRTNSALESKRHLEHFIDTTSHEMRNPLSAIMQCADGILTSYAGPEGDQEMPTPATYFSLLEQTLDAAQTIGQCAQHMKRIVDDILTISKLDSGLLVITPIEAQPECVAHHAVKMFEAEAKAAGVAIGFEVDQSYRDLKVNWASLDPTRLLQILINLLTNAIKFTRLERRRQITVSIAASVTAPASATNGVQFVCKKLDDDRVLQDDWKRGPTLYIQFSVADTGRGLSEEERSTLFSRFSQASPRTHIHYGGSGLGLFISRRLTEMQGGAIGLASEYRKGSTFSFYIKTRRANPTSTRKGSLPNFFPEDMRHRPSTPQEIDRLLNPPRPPHVFRHTYSGKLERGRSNSAEANKTLQHSRSSSWLSKQSMMHSDIPPEALGIPVQSSMGKPDRSTSLPESLHVLVVEDNIVNQKVLAKQLHNLGCIVSVANHGAEALEFLQKTTYWNPIQIQRRCSTTALPHHHNGLVPTTIATPAITLNANDQPLPVDLHIILMDWEMPVMNGLTAVAKIREMEKKGILKSRVPIIGVTANVRQQQIQTAMKAGMDDVVGKPFRVVELLGRMKSVVGGLGDEGGGRIEADEKAKRMV